VNYQVALDPHAKRQLTKLDPNTRGQLLEVLTRLTAEPRPAGVKRLSGEVVGWRIRSGKYRILYQINDSNHTVTVYDIDLRDSVYKRK
jgi:mRNA interferase RelE/StbE